MDLQNKQVFTKNRATALSMNAIIMDSVGVGTNVVFGYLAEYSITFAFLLGAGLCLGGLIMFFMWYRNQKVIVPNVEILHK